MPKRIVEVCSAHPSNDGRVFKRSSVTLAEAGYEVHQITADEKFDPYVSQGVIIHPLKPILSTRERFGRRKEVAKLAASLEPDLYHVHEPELLGTTLKFAGGKPVIFDVHELYVDVLLDRDWLPKPLRPAARFIWDKVERNLVRKCAAVVTVTSGVNARYASMHPRTIVIANYPDLSDHLALSPATRDGLQCIFAGTLSENRGLFEMIEAFAILKQRGCPARLHIAGKGSLDLMQRMRDLVESKGLNGSVEISGPFDRLDGLKMANSSSIGMVPHLPYGNNLVAWPVKLFDFMALGLPVIYSSLPCHFEVIGDAQVGIALPSCSPEDIANAVEKLTNDYPAAALLGENGRALVQNKLNWDVEKQKLLGLVRELIGEPT